MPYPFPLRIEGLLVEEESTYGTDPTPQAATDGIQGAGRIWSALSSEYVFPNLREEVVSNSPIQAAPGIPHGRIMNIDYEVILRGAGAAYSSSTPVRPEVDALLMACGMSRTHVDTGGSETVTYAIETTVTDHSSATLYVYAGGKEFQVVGCRGSWTWNPLAGQLGRMRFQLQGMLAAVSESAVPSITYDSTAEPAAISMGLAIVPNGSSSWTPNVAGMEVNIGWEADRFDDVNAADGVEGFFMGMASPRMTFTPRVEDLSDYAAYALANARTDHTIDMTLGSTQYNRVDLDVNLAYLMNDPQFGEDGNFAAWEAEYLLRDLALVFD